MFAFGIAATQDFFQKPLLSTRAAGGRLWPTICRSSTLGLALVLAGGCAGWRSTAVSPADAAPRVRQSAVVRDAVVRDFEQRRDAAQLAAALDRWQQGDPAAARAMLMSLVERRPDHFEARLRLGELLWSEGDGPAAEDQLRAALALRPEAAEAHHALGLVLWGTGRQAEGRHHLEKAAALAPDNEAYRLACQP